MPIIFKSDKNVHCENGFIRGQRGKLIDWSDCDCTLSEDELEKILKPFMEYECKWVGGEINERN
ncbi:hypothetical protein [Clostridium sp. 1001283B150210_160208_E6]|uniref:hypothetical protein n=1 Tax=Clostridium sp. 1001283B150210_160208_E6 TaxID=2787129 RepID=UPI0018AB145D|nr:hypothetical protein [Clostridium sp. 1001283B150210_160208_E6]